jgi:hypothetical protein
MAKRGKRSAKSARGGKVGPRANTERDSEDIRRLRRAAGSWEKLLQRIKEEPPVLEDFDDAFLPGLAWMEENFWKHQRSPEARRIYRQRILELRQQEKDPAKRVKGRIHYPATREEIVRLTVEPFWRKELGPTKDDVVRRLIRKLRRYKPPK